MNISFWWAIIASVAVSLVSLIGIITFFVKDKLLDKILILIIGFSAGGLIGGAFLHLIPESLEKRNYVDVFSWVILGFIVFFFLERYLHWRHCHEGHCDVHAFTYLSIVGDATHNFIDGLTIGASFVVSVHIGVAVTIAIICHEIPHELGNYGILIYGGFSKLKALLYNFLSAVTAIIGTVIGYIISTHAQNFAVSLMPFAAGGFIYIASCDLIPELHKQPNTRKAALSMVLFVFGIILMLILKEKQ